MTQTKRRLNELADHSEKIILRITKSRLDAAAADIENEIINTAEKMKENETVASYIVRATQKFKPKSPSDFYVYWLGVNSIVDTTKTELLCEEAEQELEKYKNESVVNNSNGEIIFQGLKYESKKDVLNSLQIVENFKTKNTNERRLKKIYFHVLDMHAYSQRNFTKEMVRFYSEGDFLQKFWSPMFESYFTETAFVTHWGDTKSHACKEANIDMKLDFRLVLGPSKFTYDTSTGEVAKLPTPTKLYEDRLKSSIAAKASINHILLNSSLTVEDLHRLNVPIIQVMGFECQIFTLSLVEPKLYLLHKKFDMNFPVTHKDLRAGSIEKIIEGLGFIEQLSVNLKELINEGEMFEVPNRMSEINSGEKTTQKKQKLTTKVLWYDEEDFEED